MLYIVAFLLFVVGSFIGLRFPDFDLAFRWYPLLVHRSLLTHSFLIPLLITISLGAHRKTASASASLATRYLTMGVCSATAVHLSFDLFPRYWTGFARLHLPFIGWAPTGVSVTCFALSTLVCLILAFRLLRNLNELYLLGAGLIVCYGVSAARQPNISFWAFVTLLLAGFAALLIARPRYEPDENILVRKYLDR